MENASKALLIAGGVLLAMLVLTIGVYVYNSINGRQDSYIAKLDADELVKYNNPYSVLMDRKDISAQEIVSVVGDSKQKNGNIKIKVYDSNGKVMYENMQTESDRSLSDFLNDNIQYSDSNKLVSFKYITSGTSNDGRINIIEFQKIGATKTTPITSIPTEPDEPDSPGYWEEEEPKDEKNRKPYFVTGKSLSDSILQTHTLTVKDPENDLVEVKEIHWEIYFPENVYNPTGNVKKYINSLKQMVRSYTTLDYESNTGTINNGGITVKIYDDASKETIGNKYDSHVRYSAKKVVKEIINGGNKFRLPDQFELSVQSGIIYDEDLCNKIEMIQFIARDNKHLDDPEDGGWVKSEPFYVRYGCDGGYKGYDGYWYKMYDTQPGGGGDNPEPFTWTSTEEPCPICGMIGSHKHEDYDKYGNKIGKLTTINPNEPNVTLINKFNNIYQQNPSVTFIGTTNNSYPSASLQLVKSWDEAKNDQYIAGKKVLSIDERTKTATVEGGEKYKWVGGTESHTCKHGLYEQHVWWD